MDEKIVIAYQSAAKHPRAELPLVRFWSKVNQDGPAHPYKPELGQCWMFEGKSQDKDGYGLFLVFKHRASKTTVIVRAHRFAYEIAHGPITEEGMHVCHSCDRVRCMRHLFIGTPGDNYRDMENKGRRYSTRGVDHPMAKYSLEQINEVRRLLADGAHNQREIGRRTGVHFGMVNNIKLGKSWRHDYSDPLLQDRD